MTSAPKSPVRRSLARIWSELPHGRTLPEHSWRVRHRAVIGLLVAHAIVLGVVSLVLQLPAIDTLVNIGVPAAGAYAASRPHLSRNFRSSIASLSPMLTSTV